MDKHNILEEGKVRLSRGSAVTLGLINLDYKEIRKRLSENSLCVCTTIYLLLYSKKRCVAKCAFCTQTSKELKDFSITDIAYPPFPIEEVADRIAEAHKEGTVKGVCCQTVHIPNYFEMIKHAATEIRKRSPISIIICNMPAPKEKLLELKKLNLTRYTISMDCATPKIFSIIKGKEAKGPYRWDRHIQGLKEAVEVFGRYKVGTHLIIGLGETEQEAFSFLQSMYDMGVYTGIGPLIPIKGTRLENWKQPPIESYRKIQIGRNLMYQDRIRIDDMKFDGKGRLIDFGVPWQEIEKLTDSGTPFLSVKTGCGGLNGVCNRPFVASSPELIYNFPRDITADELKNVKKQVQKFSDK